MRYFIIDAFAERLFEGNQAGVCLLDEWIERGKMQAIAFENNLAETAFVVRRGDEFELKWFTPTVEIDLCGHATLAASYVVSRFVDEAIGQMRFHTASGLLTVEKDGELFVMDFPARVPVSVPVTEEMLRAIGAPVLEAHLSRDLLLLVENESEVRSLSPDIAAIENLPDGKAVIVTARGEDADFVSRFFAPKMGIAEDPVTGSAHATLVPFWAERLEKTKLIARQLSRRGGTLFLEHLGERVKIAGKAQLYLEGELWI